MTALFKVFFAFDSRRGIADIPAACPRHQAFGAKELRQWRAASDFEPRESFFLTLPSFSWLLLILEANFDICAWLASLPQVPFDNCPSSGA